MPQMQEKQHATRDEIVAILGSLDEDKLIARWQDQTFTRAGRRPKPPG
jgi:hypothetical protein